MRTKRLFGIIILAASLAACETKRELATESDSKMPEGYIGSVEAEGYISWIFHVPDDRNEVDCWVMVGHSKGGISCLWRKDR